MYYIYWIKPDDSVGTESLKNHKDLHSWMEYRGRYLCIHLYAYATENRFWATYVKTPMKLSKPWIDTGWSIPSPERVPPAIRAYHLLTH